MTTEEMYEKFGIKKDVIDFGKNVLKEIDDRFTKIDEVAEINQLKVIHAMQKNRVSENHLWGTTGYGYNDTGRDTLEAVYADIFEAREVMLLVGSFSFLVFSPSQEKAPQQGKSDNLRLITGFDSRSVDYLAQGLMCRSYYR